MRSSSSVRPKPSDPKPSSGLLPSVNGITKSTYLQVSACHSLGIYPTDESMIYDEDTPIQASHSSNFFQLALSFRGGEEVRKQWKFCRQLCQDWEAAGQLGEDAGVRQTRVRLGLVLGRTGGIVRELYAPFLFGLGGPLGSGRQWFPWVHIDDVCGIILHAIESEETEKVSGILNAVSPGIVRQGEFATAFATAMGRKAVVRVPELMVQAMYGSERAAMFLSGQQIVPKRTIASDYEFIYPTIREAAAEFARPFNVEERTRLGSINEPVSLYQHQLFQVPVPKQFK